MSRVVFERLTPREQRIVRAHRTPLQVQRYLDRMPYNYEEEAGTLRSFRSTLAAGRGHCLEAALVATGILEQHGYPPLLLDLESVDKLDHVLFVFKKGGRWGSIARSRDPGLHGRKPVFAHLDELVRSYQLPYIDRTGRIKGYGLLDLRQVKRCNWRFSKRNVWALEKALNDNRHRRLTMPDATYERWRKRYVRFMNDNPGRKPLYYPKREQWLSAGPKPGIDTTPARLRH